jgi:hypothetical protein
LEVDSDRSLAWVTDSFRNEPTFSAANAAAKSPAARLATPVSGPRIPDSASASNPAGLGAEPDTGLTDDGDHGGSLRSRSVHGGPHRPLLRGEASPRLAGRLAEGVRSERVELGVQGLPCPLRLLGVVQGEGLDHVEHQRRR